MNYEINISLNGQHFFATAKRSLTTEADLLKVWPTLVAAFPESEGYKLSVSRVTTTGRSADTPEELLAQ